MARPFPPPPLLVARPLVDELFFAASLSPKIGGTKKVAKNRFQLFYDYKRRKIILLPFNPRGGGEGLNGPAIRKKIFFCGFPNQNPVFRYMAMKNVVVREIQVWAILLPPGGSANQKFIKKKLFGLSEKEMIKKSDKEFAQS